MNKSHWSAHLIQERELLVPLLCLMMRLLPLCILFFVTIEPTLIKRKKENARIYCIYTVHYTANKKNFYL
jgi:hypothetical protein